MPPRNSTDEAQAKAVARGRTARFEADKAVQHALPIRLGNAQSLIRYFEDRLPVFGEDPQLDLAVPGIFESIVEEIGERLRQEVPVAAYPNAGLGHHRQSKPLFLGDRLIEISR